MRVQFRSQATGKIRRVKVSETRSRYPKRCSACGVEIQVGELKYVPRDAAGQVHTTCAEVIEE